jgi:DNA-binding transcriptional regulator YhcF (GntR family)
MSEVETITRGVLQPQQRQVIQSVLEYAATHRIPVGGKLPPIRAISKDTGIAPATIAKALQQIARHGIVESKGRNGTILLRSLATTRRKTLQRIILLNGLDGTVSESIMGGVHDYGLRVALKNLSPEVEVYTTLYSGKEGHESDEYLENLVRYHTQVGRNGGMIFLLGNCSRKVKQFFAERNLPTLIIGGNDPDIDLTNVSFDIPGTVSEVMNILQEGDGFPAAFIRDIRVLFAEQKVLLDEFCIEAQRRNLSSKEFTIWDTSDSRDLFRGMLASLLRENGEVRTLITRADDVATWAMRVCVELGLQKQVRLISLGGSLLGEWYLPTITGLHRDFYSVAQQILEVANMLCNGEKPPQRTYTSKSVMVFRESFPNPYLRSENSF